MATGRVEDGGYNPHPRPRSHSQPPSTPPSPLRGKNFPPSPSPTGINLRRVFTGDFCPSVIPPKSRPLSDNSAFCYEIPVLPNNWYDTHYIFVPLKFQLVPEANPFPDVPKSSATIPIRD
uniref:Uncharacterized protein n=1 Tax=Opuntia streptacantha TaxID=393608 RepID=A0A7C8ZD90_OPUST